MKWLAQTMRLQRVNKCYREAESMATAESSVMCKILSDRNTIL